MHSIFTWAGEQPSGGHAYDRVPSFLVLLILFRFLWERKEWGRKYNLWSQRSRRYRNNTRFSSTKQGHQVIHHLGTQYGGSRNYSICGNSLQKCEIIAWGSWIALSHKGLSGWFSLRRFSVNHKTNCFKKSNFPIISNRIRIKICKLVLLTIIEGWNSWRQGL